jgi:hypothetical protein
LAIIDCFDPTPQMLVLDARKNHSRLRHVCQIDHLLCFCTPGNKKEETIAHHKLDTSLDLSHTFVLHLRPCSHTHRCPRLLWSLSDRCPGVHP